jgi:Tfp pilus assembly protein PilF
MSAATSQAGEHALLARRDLEEEVRKPRDVPMVLTALRSAAYGEPDGGAVTGTGQASREARQKYELGAWHRLRGEYAQSAARFQEALALDAKMLSARCDLGGVLLLQGDVQGAEGELQRVLADDPSHRPALKSLALVQVKRRHYQTARQTLEKVIRLDPGDADAWLALGDVRMFGGDRAGARQAWEKAHELSASGEVRESADKRLAMYPIKAATGME